jgi:hypothetical protein
LRVGDSTDVLARLDSAVLAELDHAQDGHLNNSNGSANGDHR